MNRKILSLLGSLVLAAGVAFGPPPLWAELQPSSDVLLPYFEVDVTDYGRNTLFAVVNAASAPVDLTIGIYTNWGIPVLEVPLSLLHNQVQSVNLREWISFGRLPGRTLSADEIAHIKAALTGQPSPKDGLYYATAMTRDRAVGYVLFRTLGDTRPDGLWGDYFVTDPQAEYLYGDTLVNLDPTVETMGVCQRHLIRFLQGGAFAAGTELYIWTGKTGKPSATPIYLGDMASTTTLAFDEAGHPMGVHTEAVLSTQMMKVADMGFAPFGSLDLRTLDETFVGGRFASGLASAAFHAYCIPLDAGGTTGAAITLGKLTNGVHAEAPPGPVVPVGTKITWEYFVQNTGSVALSPVTVVDSPAVPLVCPKDSLQPGESMVCTATASATGCQYHNVATATGVSPTGETVSAEDVGYYFGDVGARFKLTAKVEGDDANTPPGPTHPVGATVHLTYELENTGVAALTDITVTDDMGVAVHCPGTTLAAGATMTCTATETATASHTHQARAQATPPCGSVLSAQDVAHHTVAAPSIRLKKLVNGDDADTAPGPSFPVGTALLWTYVVTNTGDAVLNQIQVTDNRGVAVTCPKSTLTPAESMTCTGSGTAQAGPYSNIGTATGHPPAGPAVTATDPCFYTGFTMGISLKKAVNGDDANTPPGPLVPVGSSLAWTYLVTNLGSTALTAVAVSDDRGVVVTCPKSTLAPAESMTCTGSSLAASGQYSNLGTATGQPPSGPAVIATDPCHYYGFRPQITIKKLTNGQEALTAPGPKIHVGDPVTWTYVVSNTGDVVLNPVQVTDNRGVVVTCPKSQLAAGESMTCTGAGTARAGQYENTGTAVGTPPSGPTVQASAVSHYFGESGGCEGCSPGYWKTHSSSWTATGYSPNTLVRDVFTQVSHYPSLSSATFMGALYFGGGTGTTGAAEILLRAAVAALLNASHPQIEYPRSASQVILSVETALNSESRDTMLALASGLDADNNLHCPLH